MSLEARLPFGILGLLREGGGGRGFPRRRPREALLSVIWGLLPLRPCVRGLKYVLALVCPCRVISGPGACDVSYDVSDYRLLLPGSSGSSTPNVFLLARETIKRISLHLPLFAALSRRRPRFLRDGEKARIEAKEGKRGTKGERRHELNHGDADGNSTTPSSCVGGLHA